METSRIRVAVLDGQYASLEDQGVPFSLCLHLQQLGLQLHQAQWTAGHSLGGFSTSFWPALEKQSLKKVKTMKKRRVDAKQHQFLLTVLLSILKSLMLVLVQNLKLKMRVPQLMHTLHEQKLSPPTELFSLSAEPPTVRTAPPTISDSELLTVAELPQNRSPSVLQTRQ